MAGSRPRAFFQVTLVLCFLTASLVGFVLFPYKSDKSLERFLKVKNRSLGAESKPGDFLNLVRMKRLEAIQKAAKSKKETYEFIIDVDIEKKEGAKL